MIIFFGKIPVTDLGNFIKKAKKYQHKFLKHIIVKNPDGETQGQPMSDSDDEPRNQRVQAEKRSSGDVQPEKIVSDLSDDAEQQLITGTGGLKGLFNIGGKTGTGGPGLGKQKNVPGKIKKKKKKIDPMAMGREVFQ